MLVQPVKLAAFLGVLCACSNGQPACPNPNFLSARTVSLEPSANSHINVVRQPDGSYTGFEAANAPPYRVIRTTPHFEQQFAACLPHVIPTSKTAGTSAENPPGAASQSQVSFTLPSGNYSVARLDVSPNALSPTIHFDLFDPQLHLVSETNFTLPGTQTQTFSTLKLAGVNGDGKLDLIAVSQAYLSNGNADFTLWVFPGNGDGTFQTPLQQDLGISVGANVTLAIGDLNGDGKPDIVIVTAPHSVALLGNGDGTFRQQSLALGALGSGSPGLALADLNGDGKLDLVRTAGLDGNYVASVAVQFGNGDATFQSPVLFPVQASASGATFTVAIGDLNGDHIPDIVTSTGTILFGDGKGGFPTRRDYAVQGSGNALLAAPDVMLADFDGDGITDILIGAGNPVFLSGSPAGSLTVLFGQGAGAFVAAPVSFAGIGGVDFTGQSLAAADFDGDGIPDLALADRADGFAAILKGKGNGEFTQVYKVNFTGGVPVSLAVADFNRDGRPDVAVLRDLVLSSEIQVFFGNGDGTLSAPLVLSDAATTPGFIGAADLNGDGIPDLVVSARNNVSIWLGKPGGAFAAPVSYSIQGGYQFTGYSVTLAFGDFNGDGKIDIAVPSQAGNIVLLLGHGDGTFSMGPVIPLSFPAGAPPGPFGPVNLVAADFNGDGRLDLAATGTSAGGALSSAFAILPGNGDGTFQPPSFIPLPAANIAAADLNGDKIPDLIVTGADFGTAVLLGNGDGTFAAAQPLSGLPLQSIAIADLNHDGLPDVAGGLLTIGVAAFLNLTTPPPPLTVVPSTTFVPGPLAADSFATAFGHSLTSQTGGVTVTVTDSAGASRAAPLFYVSPGQINFLVPAATAPGAATVTVNSGTGKFSAPVQIAALAPSLFTVGSGIAAAYVIQVAPDGGQQTQLVFTSQSGTIAPLPIQVNTGSQVFLILFGTGFDAIGAGAVQATVQGVSVPVTYAGPQPQIPGLDQVNLMLPSSLAGQGLSSVVLSIDGLVANTVYVTIQ